MASSDRSIPGNQGQGSGTASAVQVRQHYRRRAFLRDDLEDIVEVMFKKTKRIVISTSGYHYKKIFKLAERFPNIGVRVSIEGLSQTNNTLRGRDEGFDRGLKTLLGLKSMGVKDIGFGITVSNRNSEDMLWLFELGQVHESGIRHCRLS
jgi:Fe-coproporphyrin III synthase